MNSLPYIEILKTKINITTMDEAVSWIDEHLAELSGKYVCISNVHTTVTAYRDEKYRAVQNGSALSLPDGSHYQLCSDIGDMRMQEECRGRI